VYQDLKLAGQVRERPRDEGLAQRR
jgi:hypothetical protein